jgi:hypothetical protein
MTIWAAPSDRDYYNEPEVATCQGCNVDLEDHEIEHGLCDACREQHETDFNAWDKARTP